MTFITASSETLFEQAMSTAHDYMARAKRDIDSMFGDGYASKNPQLVAAFMQVSASDFTTSIQGKLFGEALENIAEAIRSLQHE